MNAYLNEEHTPPRTLRDFQLENLPMRQRRASTGMLETADYTLTREQGVLDWKKLFAHLGAESEAQKPRHT